MKITVLGAGAWGTTIAHVLTDNGDQVTLWCKEREVVDSIARKKCNEQFLPDITLSPLITPTNDLIAAIKDAEWIFVAVPVQHFRSVLKQIKTVATQDQKWVLLNKGIENETLLLPSRILQQELSSSIFVAALMGPSFAKDLAVRQLTAVTAASSDAQLASQLQVLVQNEYLRVSISQDLVGVQLCAALKNVITIGMGILDGAGYTDNTKAFYLVRSLAEIRELVVTLGGTSETVNGFAGIGDLVLTALGKYSRNLTVGRLLGQGQTLADILAIKKTIAEGVATTDSVYHLLQDKKQKLPLFESLYHVIHQAASVENFIKVLEA